MERRLDAARPRSPRPRAVPQRRHVPAGDGAWRTPAAGRRDPVVRPAARRRRLAHRHRLRWRRNLRHPDHRGRDRHRAPRLPDSAGAAEPRRRTAGSGLGPRRAAVDDHRPSARSGRPVGGRARAAAEHAAGHRPGRRRRPGHPGSDRGDPDAGQPRARAGRRGARGRPRGHGLRRGLRPARARADPRLPRRPAHGASPAAGVRGGCEPRAPDAAHGHPRLGRTSPQEPGPAGREGRRRTRRHRRRGRAPHLARGRPAPARPIRLRRGGARTSPAPSRRRRCRGPRPQRGSGSRSIPSPLPPSATPPAFASS